MRKEWRHRAREAALQILYQWQVGKMELARASETFFTRQWADPEPPSDQLRASADRLAAYTVAHLEAIDRLIAETSEHWRPERLAVIDRLVLRMAIGELLVEDGEQKAPAAVVIDEALELARTFSTEDAVKFINGMLDAIRKKLTPTGS